MTGLSTIMIRKQGEATPFCEVPNCVMTRNGTFPSYATVQMFLIGHPIGWYCKRHAKEIRAAYDSAHGTFEPGELAA